MDWIWIEVEARSEGGTRTAWYEVVNGRLVLRDEGDPAEGGGEAILAFQGLSLEEAKQKVEAVSSRILSVSIWCHYALHDWLAPSGECLARFSIERLLPEENRTSSAVEARMDPSLLGIPIPGCAMHTRPCWQHALHTNDLVPLLHLQPEERCQAAAARCAHSLGDREQGGFSARAWPDLHSRRHCESDPFGGTCLPHGCTKGQHAGDTISDTQGCSG